MNKMDVIFWIIIIEIFPTFSIRHTSGVIKDLKAFLNILDFGAFLLKIVKTVIFTFVIETAELLCIK